MVESILFKELLSIELKKEIHSVEELSNDERLYALYLLKAIKKYERQKVKIETFKLKYRTKELFFSLSYQITFLISLLSDIKNHYGRVLISEIVYSKFQKRKELFE